jgi:hypothetical protein
MMERPEWGKGPNNHRLKPVLLERTLGFSLKTESLRG